MEIKNLFKLFTIITFVSLAFLSDFVFAQSSAEDDLNQALPNKKEKLFAQLVLISQRMDTVRGELKGLNKSVPTKEVLERIEELQGEFDSLNKNFETRATQITFKDLPQNNQENIGWIEELQEITRPLLSTIREFSDKPRMVDTLKAKIETLEYRIEQYKAAIKNLEHITELRKNLKIKNRKNGTTFNEKIEQLKTKYNPELLYFELEETQRNLDQIKTNKKSFWEFFAESVVEFAQVRGRNLVIALSFFLVTFLFLNTIYKLIRKRRRLFRGINPNLKKVFKTAFTTLTLVISLGMGLLVLYLQDDWLLLSIVILVFLAILWASRQLIPQFIKELRIIMNLGTVREGERVIWSGVPWLVKEIGFYVTLENTRLDGGRLQIPVGEMMGTYSRPLVENEVWFPTKKKDYVILEDGAFGRIENQSMEQVVLYRLGSLKYYPTEDFLKLKPLNLSKNFKIVVRFGLDYGVQNDICEKIPALFEEGLKKNLQKYYSSEPPAILSLNVNFEEAAASSLNLIIVAAFHGKYAEDYYPLKWEINKIMVQICNENNFTIPFTQLTVSLPEGAKEIIPGSNS
jgi:small-conductance mechanosensitive channel